MSMDENQKRIAHLRARDNLTTAEQNELAQRMEDDQVKNPPSWRTTSPTGKPLDPKTRTEANDYVAPESRP